jgi:erythromycin esterase-like protein
MTAIRPLTAQDEANSDASFIAAVREQARPLTGDATDFDPIAGLYQHASFVLIGEASHGTHEFYETRARLTKRLIEENGFNGVLVEADWPDAYRINRFVRLSSDENSAEHVLSGFDKFPEWMWRNTNVKDFISWLREHNEGQSDNATRTGFYGMDLYSLFRSRDAVLSYLAEVDPSEAERAAERYAPFNDLGGDPQRYGYAVAIGSMASAAELVEEQLAQVRRVTDAFIHSQDPVVAEAAFNALQNALVVKNAEEYYREMYDGRVNTWNLRDRHMADTLDALAEHLRSRDGYARIAVWAHNSHIGDARATDSSLRGEWNLGQLVRERHPDDSALVGFSTYTGTVIASSNWGEPAVIKDVRPGMSGSFELAFHEAGIPAFVLPLREPAVAEQLRGPRLQRAIGVIYLPETERQSHYFRASIADQFDAVIHIDETRALDPLPSEESGTETSVAA